MVEGPPPAPDPSRPPAGWYADPEGHGQRWWDGTAWSAYRTPTGPAIDPVPGRTLASFGQRVGAFLLDGLVMFAVVLLVGVIGALAVVVVSRLAGRLPDGLVVIGALGGYLVGLGVLIVVPIAYRAELHRRPAGATIGKALVGIEVVDRRTGGRLTRGRAWGRAAFNSLVSGQVCYLGYLWMLWDPEKRTWHDAVVDSHVVVRDGPKARVGDLFRR